MSLLPGTRLNQAQLLETAAATSCHPEHEAWPSEQW